MTTFTLRDVEEAERKHGVAYFIASNGRHLIPATHVGPDRLGVISIHPSPAGDIVNWRVTDANGETVLHGGGRAVLGWRSGVREALRWLASAGCECRVKPGDRGPWGGGEEPERS